MVAVQEALKRAKTDAAEVQEVIMGLVLSGNTGAGPARQVCINAGIPHDTSTAYAINQLCASGMRAIGEGFNSIKVGDNSVQYQRLEPYNQPLAQLAAVAKVMVPDARIDLQRDLKVLFAGRRFHQGG